jgi:hypothetical protein
MKKSFNQMKWRGLGTALIRMAVYISLGFVLAAFVMQKGCAVPLVEEKTAVSDTVIKNQLSACSKLVSTTYNYTKVGEYENSLQINGWTIPLTSKTFLLTYDGQMLLGTDLSEAIVHADDSAITVILAPMEILSNTLDESSVEVWNEQNNLFNPISISDYTLFAAQEKEKAAQEVQSKAIWTAAEDNALEAVKQLLKTVYPEQTVTVSWQ